jgi:hypothetical protein
MPEYHAIEASLFCSQYAIDPSFIQTLQEYGLLHTNIISGAVYIPEDELPSLEKMMRLHFEMDINIEGIETIHYLLQKIENMQEEMQQLRNRIAVYEALAG